MSSAVSTRAVKWARLLSLVVLSHCGVLGSAERKQLTLVGVEASRDEEGMVHLHALVQNGDGQDRVPDFHGDFCVQATWRKDAKIEDAPEGWSAKGGTEIAHTEKVCRTDLAAGAIVHLDVISQKPVNDRAIIEVEFTEGTNVPSISSSLITSPP